MTAMAAGPRPEERAKMVGRAGSDMPSVEANYRSGVKVGNEEEPCRHETQASYPIGAIRRADALLK
jgi:hypothetical protein